VLEIFNIPFPKAKLGKTLKIQTNTSIKSLEDGSIIKKNIIHGNIPPNIT